MSRYCLFIVIPFLLASSCFAQHVELCLGGGGVYNTTALINIEEVHSVPAHLSVMGSASLSCNIRKFRLGLALSSMQLSKTSWQYYPYRPTTKAWFHSINPPYSSTRFFLNRQFFTLKKIDLYAGLSAGMLSYQVETYGFGIGHETSISGIYGLQAGANLYFTKHFGLNAELGSYYATLKGSPHAGAGNEQSLGSMLLLPLTVGICFRL